MAKDNNLKDLLTDVADAIRRKKGTTDLINPQDFSAEIDAIESGGGGSDRPSIVWTGHADAEGLRAIGWTDEDIAYYQENGVNWNEEDDEYHKVTDDNKALYGVLTADNISTYKDRIVYLPKIDTSALTNMSSMFQSCNSLVAIPLLDTSNVTNMTKMFYECRSLVSIPPLDTAKVTTMNTMFRNCSSLVSIPQFNTQNVTDMGYLFNSCSSLVSIPQLDTQKVQYTHYMFGSCFSLVSIPQLNTQKVVSSGSMFSYCYSLVYIPLIDTQKVGGMYNASSMFDMCYSLTHVKLKNVKFDYRLPNSGLLSKESLLYLINNETSTSVFTIYLASYAYTRWANDPDIVAALANHPNMSLASL